MKKIGLFLLAVMMVAGLAGCSSDGDDKLDAADIAGTYTYTDTTDDVTLSWTYVLTSSGTFTLDLVDSLGPLHQWGTFTVDDPTILFTFTEPPGQIAYGEIVNGGETISVYGFIFTKK